jgi:hypothetical protein
MERAYELGYRRQQQQQLDALLLSEAAKSRRERRGCRLVEQARRG